jgi:hypothetical protein
MPKGDWQNEGSFCLTAKDPQYKTKQSLYEVKVYVKFFIN